MMACPLLDSMDLRLRGPDGFHQNFVRQQVMSELLGLSIQESGRKRACIVHSAPEVLHENPFPDSVFHGTRK